MNDFPIGTGAQKVLALNFMYYAQARVFGMSKERAAEIFPQAESFERAYQDKLKTMEGE